MSRNPHATNLRHFKPKRIEDKRERARAMGDLFLMDADLMFDGLDFGPLTHAERNELLFGDDDD